MALTLVTGATGFIGSHVVTQLLERGEPVRVLVRNPAKLGDVGLGSDTPGLEVAVGDLLEPHTLPAALEGVTHVHHIAGVISTDRRDAQKMFDLNLATTRNLFDAVERAEVEKVVYLASIFALSGGEPTPASEESPWLQNGLRVPYVQAKREAELHVRGLAERGAPIVFVYPCFCYGPGDVYNSSSELLVGFLEGKIPAYVNGGHNAMDVRDAAHGLLLGMERGKPGERYIVGGENVSFEQLFALLARITGRRAPRIKLPPALARVAGRIAERVMKNPPLTEQIALMTERHWYYDDGKARRNLGYESRPLEQTMRDAVAWWKERGVG